MDINFRLDFLVAELVVVELKAVEKIFYRHIVNSGIDT